MKKILFLALLMGSAISATGPEDEEKKIGKKTPLKNSNDSNEERMQLTNTARQQEERRQTEIIHSMLDQSKEFAKKDFEEALNDGLDPNFVKQHTLFDSIMFKYKVGQPSFLYNDEHSGLENPYLLKQKSNNEENDDENNNFSKREQIEKEGYPGNDDEESSEWKQLKEQQNSTKVDKCYDTFSGPSTLKAETENEFPAVLVRPQAPIKDFPPRIFNPDATIAPFSGPSTPKAETENEFPAVLVRPQAPIKDFPLRTFNPDAMIAAFSGPSTPKAETENEFPAVLVRPQAPIKDFSPRIFNPDATIAPFSGPSTPKVEKDGLDYESLLNELFNISKDNILELSIKFKERINLNDDIKKMSEIILDMIYESREKLKKSVEKKFLETLEKNSLYIIDFTKKAQDS